MDRRTLSLLATPAVLAAMIVAVPAVAGSGQGARSAQRTTAHAASSGEHCFSAVVGKRHVRECLIAGARGPRGFLGPNGPRGIRGATGKGGATGPSGPAGAAGASGTARAYALIQPEIVASSPSSAGLVPGQSVGFAAIHRPATGIYCLAPVGTIDAASEAPVVSGEAGYSGSETAVPLAVIYARQPTRNCGPNEFEVKTYNLLLTGEKLSNEVAFTIIVP